MHRWRYIPAAWLMTTVFQLACWGQSSAEFTLAIHTNTPTVKSGARVRLDITVTNISDHPICFYKARGAGGQAEAANSFEARDASGNRLRRIDGYTVWIHGEAHTKLPLILSRKGVVLKPDETLDDFTTLSNLFDLTKPGRYTVTARQAVPFVHPGAKPSGIIAASNTIEITVSN
jgi:hypothetical protein